MGFDGLLDDKQVARDLTPLLASVGLQPDLFEDLASRGDSAPR